MITVHIWPPSSEIQYTSMVFFPCLLWNTVLIWSFTVFFLLSTSKRTELDERRSEIRLKNKEKTHRSVYSPESASEIWSSDSMASSTSKAWLTVKHTWKHYWNCSKMVRDIHTQTNTTYPQSLTRLGYPVRPTCGEHTRRGWSQKHHWDQTNILYFWSYSSESHKNVQVTFQGQFQVTLINIKTIMHVFPPNLHIFPPKFTFSFQIFTFSIKISNLHISPLIFKSPPIFSDFPFKFQMFPPNSKF